jgi:hypothetical protein
MSRYIELISHSPGSAISLASPPGSAISIKPPLPPADVSNRCVGPWWMRRGKFFGRSRKPTTA